MKLQLTSLKNYSLKKTTVFFGRKQRSAQKLGENFERFHIFRGLKPSEDAQIHNAVMKKLS